MIRIATEADAAACHAIYAPVVETSAITFETELPGVEAMRGRIRTRLATHPWLVWEEDGEVIALCLRGSLPRARRLRLDRGDLHLRA